MKILASLLLTATALLSACGDQSSSQLNDWKDWKNNDKHDSNNHGSKKLKLVCEIKVNQFKDGLLSGEVTAKVSGSKKFANIQEAYADATELASVISATDRKCSADGIMKVNTAACSQLVNVNTGNVGRFNTFSINGGLSTGYYQCNAQ